MELNTTFIDTIKVVINNHYNNENTTNFMPWNLPGSCVCVASDFDFINKINELNPNQFYNEMSEKLFNEKLSDEAQIDFLSAFFKSLEDEQNY